MLKAVEFLSHRKDCALGLHPKTEREIDGARVKIGPTEAFESEPDWQFYAGGRHQVSVDACGRMIVVGSLG